MEAKRHKTGGRKVGTPNRITKDLKRALSEVLEQEVKNLPGLLKELRPENRVQVVMKLASILLPSSVIQEITTTDKTPPPLPTIIDWGGNKIPI